jgi:hypothetical protein
MVANHDAVPFPAGLQETTENHASPFDTSVNAKPEHYK